LDTHRFQSIQNASINGNIHPHKAAGEKNNRAINGDDPRMIHLKNHFEFLHKLAEDRALKEINTVIDGEGGHANRMDTDDQPHRWRWVAVALGDSGSVG
jgi:hypothetical protein